MPHSALGLSHETNSNLKVNQNLAQHNFVLIKELSILCLVLKKEIVEMRKDIDKNTEKINYIYDYTVKKKEKVIKSLKISVREVNEEDISSRNLNKNTKGVVITNIENKSPLASVLSVNDIIIEVQKNPVKNSSDLKNIVDGIFKKGEKTLLITVIDKNNRRRYLGVKIN